MKLCNPVWGFDYNELVSNGTFNWEERGGWVVVSNVWDAGFSLFTREGYALYKRTFGYCSLSRYTISFLIIWSSLCHET